MVENHLEMIIAKALEDALIATGVFAKTEPDGLIDEFISKKLDRPEEELKKILEDELSKLALMTQLIFLSDPKIILLRELLGEREFTEIYGEVGKWWSHICETIPPY